MANDYILYGYFEVSGSAKSGLTDVTIQVRRVSTGALIVNGSAVTEVGNGWYKYVCTTEDDTYVSTMHTGSAVTVDRKDSPWIADKNDVLLLPTLQARASASIVATASSIALIPTNAASASAVDQIYTSMATTADISDASASAVWNKSLVVHSIIGSTGSKLNIVSTASSVANITGTSASTIWEHVDRKLTSASNLNLTSSSAIASDVWSYANRTLSSLNNVLSNIASSVWSYVHRTLGDDSSVGAPSDHQIDAIRGDTFEEVFTEIDLTDYTKAYFTVKSAYKDADTDSVLQVSNLNGLMYLNGASASSISTSGSLALDALNEIVTVTVSASAMAQIPYSSQNYVYDLQFLTSGSKVVTYQSGVFALVRDVTKAIT
jgi:hypothetical protein